MHTLWFNKYQMFFNVLSGHFCLHVSLNWYQSILDQLNCEGLDNTQPYCSPFSVDNCSLLHFENASAAFSYSSFLQSFRQPSVTPRVLLDIRGHNNVGKKKENVFRCWQNDLTHFKTILFNFLRRDCQDWHIS